MQSMSEAKGGGWILDQLQELAAHYGEMAAQAAKWGHRPERVARLAQKAAHYGRLVVEKREAQSGGQGLGWSGWSVSKARRGARGGQR